MKRLEPGSYVIFEYLDRKYVLPVVSNEDPEAVEVAIKEKHGPLWDDTIIREYLGCETFEEFYKIVHVGIMCVTLDRSSVDILPDTEIAKLLFEDDMFKEGELVEYQKTLHFIVENQDNNLVLICPVDKVELFSSGESRRRSLVKNSYVVHKNNLKLNISGRL